MKVKHGDVIYRMTTLKSTHYTPLRGTYENIIVIKLGGIAIENLNDAFIQQINAWHLENKK